jgi:hypothetical protein
MPTIESYDTASTTTATECECESIMCIQAWPQSCHCATAAARSCFEKCGGPEPTYSNCPAISPPLIVDESPLPEPTPEPTPVPLPSPIDVSFPDPIPEPKPSADCFFQFTCFGTQYEQCICENAGNELRIQLCGGSVLPPLVRCPCSWTIGTRD